LIKSINTGGCVITIYIIDEWLWSDLRGENEKKRQKEAIEFIEAIFEKCDRIAVAKGSKFQKKENKFSKEVDKDIRLRAIARFYFYQIRWNLDKYIEINVDDTELDDEYLKNIKPDDAYLLRTYHKLMSLINEHRSNILILTTDKPLKEALDEKGISCNLRDEFLKEYIK